MGKTSAGSMGAMPLSEPAAGFSLFSWLELLFPAGSAAPPEELPLPEGLISPLEEGSLLSEGCSVSPEEVPPLPDRKSVV